MSDLQKMLYLLSDETEPNLIEKMMYLLRDPQDAVIETPGGITPGGITPGATEVAIGLPIVDGVAIGLPIVDGVAETEPITYDDDCSNPNNQDIIADFITIDGKKGTKRCITGADFTNNNR